MLLAVEFFFSSSCVGVAVGVGLFLSFGIVVGGADSVVVGSGVSGVVGGIAVVVIFIIKLALVLTVLTNVVNVLTTCP